MDGENNGKPYEQMDDLGGKPPYFWKHPSVLFFNSGWSDGRDSGAATFCISAPGGQGGDTGDPCVAAGGESGGDTGDPCVAAGGESGNTGGAGETESRVT